VVDPVDEFELVLSRPGSSPMKHLVVDEADRPEVRLCGVFSFFKDLRRHVKRCPDDRFHHRFLTFEALGEPKVTQLAGRLLEEDVGRLEIPVDDSAFVEILGPIHDVPEIAFGLSLGDPLLLVQ